MIWRVIFLWFISLCAAFADLPRHSSVTSVSSCETFALPEPANGISVNNTAAVQYSDLTFATPNLTLTNGANTFTVIATNLYGLKVTNVTAGNLPSSVSLLYDANGNLTNDNTRSFQYDAENQLTNVQVAGAWRVGFLYDGLHRRCIEQDSTWTGSTWSKTNETHFLYDGLQPIQELDSNNNALVTYTRGLDLSQTLNGAGGVGGLLARTDSNGSAFYHTDLNGNVTTLIDQYQHIVARYEYGPFLLLIGAWGSMASLNRMTASSMPRLGVSGAIGFPSRGYDPALTRWLNRDPIGEIGGANLYGFAANSPINVVDPFGLQETFLNPQAAQLASEIESGAFESQSVAAQLAREADAVSFAQLAAQQAAENAENAAAVAAGLAAGEAVIHLPNGDLYSPPLPLPARGQGPPRKPPCTTKSSPPFGPGDNEGAARGREAHKWWNPPPGFQKNFKFDSGGIADAANLETHEILELKTSAADVQAGREQLARYIQAAEQQFGGNWTGKVIDQSGSEW